MRVRGLEQEEEDQEHWFNFWINKRLEWYKSLGISEDKLRIRTHEEDELAHYAYKTSDIDLRN